MSPGNVGSRLSCECTLLPDGRARFRRVGRGEGRAAGDVFVEALGKIANKHEETRYPWPPNSVNLYENCHPWPQILGIHMDNCDPWLQTLLIYMRIAIHGPKP